MRQPAPSWLRPTSHTHTQAQFHAAGKVVLRKRDPKHSRCADLRCWLSKRWVGCVADDPAVAQLNGAAAVSRIRLRVRDLNDSGARLIQFAEEFHNFLGLIGM